MLQKINGYSPDTKITPVGSIAVGKWFTPYLGLRLEGNSGDLKMYNPWESPVGKKSMAYLSFYGDLTWNLTNTFGGYNEERVVNVIPFAGIGYTAILKDNFWGWKPWELPISAGLKIDFRINHYINIFIQDRFVLISNRFDGTSAKEGRYLDPLMTLTAGVTWKIGKNRFTAYNPYEEQLLINSLNDKINVLRQDLDKCLSRKCLTQAEVKQEIAQDCPPCDLNSVVRFKINSAVISREQQVNVFNAAEWMKKHPQAVIEVVGYADKDTGTPEYNMELSMRREIGRASCRERVLRLV